MNRAPSPPPAAAPRQVLALLILAGTTVTTVAPAQHPAAIAINNYSSPAEERVQDARLSPDGLWVGYATFEANPFGGGTLRLLLRPADVASTAPVTVYSVTQPGNPFYLSYTWRQVGGVASILYSFTSSANTTYIYEYTPGLGAVERLVRPGTPNGPEPLFLQFQPCGDRLAGSIRRTSSSLDTSTLWTADLGGPQYVTLVEYATTTVQTGGLGALDVSPDNGSVLYRHSNGSSSTDYRLTVASGTKQQIGASLFGTSSASFTGFLDNQSIYADTWSSTIFGPRPSVMRTDMFVPDIVTANNVLSAREGVAMPAHLGGSGNKDFIVCVARDVDASGAEVGPTGVRLHPTVYGGDIRLWDMTGGLWASVANASIDRTASRVAFVARDNGGDAQIFTVATNREIHVTYSNPVTTTTGGTYTATAGCGLNEVCILAVAATLAPAPIVWGPPGQIELDPAGAILFASGAGAPVTGSFTLPDDPANHLLPLFFQAVRFDATSNNTSRTARVRFL